MFNACYHTVPYYNGLMTEGRVRNCVSKMPICSFQSEVFVIPFYKVNRFCKILKIFSTVFFLFSFIMGAQK
jgi:hypothetical protein